MAHVEKKKKVAAYKVYAFRHPVTRKFVYVGVTKNIQSRLNAHVDFRLARALVVGKILDPEVVILETVASKRKEIACIREAYWIEKLANSGHPLLNVAGNRKEKSIALLCRVPSAMKLELTKLADDKGIGLADYLVQVLLPAKVYSPVVKKPL